MNVKLIAEFIAANHNISKKTAEEIVKDTFEVVANEVADGNEVTIAGFGKFTPTERSARTGRNPQTGAAVEIAAKTVPTFKAAKQFKDLVASR